MGIKLSICVKLRIKSGFNVIKECLSDIIFLAVDQNQFWQSVGCFAKFLKFLPFSKKSWKMLFWHFLKTFVVFPLGQSFKRNSIHSLCPFLLIFVHFIDFSKNLSKFENCIWWRHKAQSWLNFSVYLIISDIFINYFKSYHSIWCPKIEN